MLLVEAMDTRDILLAIVIVALGAALVYFLDPTFGGLVPMNSHPKCSMVARKQ